MLIMPFLFSKIRPYVRQLKNNNKIITILQSHRYLAYHKQTNYVRLNKHNIPINLYIRSQFLNIYKNIKINNK
jgi:hypothetical protein